jgi:hypothetical protein
MKMKDERTAEEHRRSIRIGAGERALGRGNEGASRFLGFTVLTILSRDRQN